MLSGSGFEFLVIGEGDSITAQLPAPNARVASGTTVILFAGEELPKEQVTVPQLSGMKYTAAKQALENRGLFIRTTGAKKSGARVEVSVQSIPAGQKTTYGSIIEVTLIDKDVVERN